MLRIKVGCCFSLSGLCINFVLKFLFMGIVFFVICLIIVFGWGIFVFVFIFIICWGK